MPLFTQRIIDKRVISQFIATTLECIKMCLKEILLSHYDLLFLLLKFQVINMPTT